MLDRIKRDEAGFALLLKYLSMQKRIFESAPYPRDEREADFTELKKLNGKFRKLKRG